MWTRRRLMRIRTPPKHWPRKVAYHPGNVVKGHGLAQGPCLARVHYDLVRRKEASGRNPHAHHNQEHPVRVVDQRAEADREAHPREPESQQTVRIAWLHNAPEDEIGQNAERGGHRAERAGERHAAAFRHRPDGRDEVQDGIQHIGQKRQNVERTFLYAEHALLYTVQLGNRRVP